MLDYPYFIDVRPPGLNEDSPITSGLPQVTMAWASPLEPEAAPDSGRTVTRLLESSSESRISTDPNVMPRITETGLSGFEPAGERGSHALGVLVEGRFESSFAGQPSPLLDDSESDTADDTTDIEAATLDGEEDAEASAADELGVVTSVIDRSPESARLFVFGSNDFLADQVLRVIGSAEGTIYGNSVQMMANVVDFALEDRSLLDIRSRGHFNRTLPPLEPAQQAGLETLNYVLALGGVGLVFLWHRRRVQRDRRLHRSWLAEASA